MNKYHINKHGVPAICKATKENCPLGNETKHFDSIEEAQEFADELHEEKYGLVFTVEEQIGQKLKSIKENNPIVIEDIESEMSGDIEGHLIEYISQKANDSFDRPIDKSGNNETTIINADADMLGYFMNNDSFKKALDNTLKKLDNEGYELTTVLNSVGRPDENFKANLEILFKNEASKEKEIYGEQFVEITKPTQDTIYNFTANYIKEKQELNSLIENKTKEIFAKNTGYSQAKNSIYHSDVFNEEDLPMIESMKYFDERAKFDLTTESEMPSEEIEKLKVNYNSDYGANLVTQLNKPENAKNKNVNVEKEYNNLNAMISFMLENQEITEEVLRQAREDETFTQFEYIALSRELLQERLDNF